MILGAKSGDQRITKDDKTESMIAQKRDELLRQADQGDLISFGIVPELVGRFPVIVPFHSFDKVNTFSYCDYLAVHMDAQPSIVCPACVKVSACVLFAG